MRKPTKYVSLMVDQDAYDNVKKLTNFRYKYQSISHFIRLAIIEKIDREVVNIAKDKTEELKKIVLDDFDF